MIPILYDKAETEFNTLGLGTLSNAYSCLVRENINGLFEFELKIPLNSEITKDLKVENIILLKIKGFEELQQFRITRVTKNSKFDVKVYGEHQMQYLTKNTTLLPEVNFHGDAHTVLKTWKDSLIPNHDELEFYSNIGTVQRGKWTIDTVGNSRLALGGVRGSILDLFGGEYKFSNNRVELLKNRGNAEPILIQFSRNVRELTQDDELEYIYTSIQPYSRYTEPTETSNGQTTYVDKVVTLPENILHGDYVSLYSQPIIKTVDFTEDNIKTVEELRARAKQFLKDNQAGKPRVNFRCSFIDLAQTEEYRNSKVDEELLLGTRVIVHSSELDIDIESRIIETTYDVINERFYDVQIGQPKASLGSAVQTVRQSEKEKNKLLSENRNKLREVQSEIEKAWMNEDGYNYELKEKNDYGLPAGYYSFNKPIDQNPTEVIGISAGKLVISNRRNSQGQFQFSTFGTGNGFVADLVYTGYLRSLNGHSWLDLDNGALNFGQGDLTYSKEKGMKVAGWHITDDGFETTISQPFNFKFTKNDFERIESIVRENQIATANDYAIYDLNGDGIINIVDLTYLEQIIKGERGQLTTRTTTIRLNPYKATIEIETEVDSTDGKKYLQTKTFIGATNLKSYTFNAGENSLNAFGFVAKNKQGLTQNIDLENGKTLEFTNGILTYVY